jgi:Protein of unknown function (DUF4232)
MNAGTPAGFASAVTSVSHAGLHLAYRLLYPKCGSAGAAAPLPNQTPPQRVIRSGGVPATARDQSPGRCQILITKPAIAAAAAAAAALALTGCHSAGAPSAGAAASSTPVSSAPAASAAASPTAGGTPGSGSAAAECVASQLTIGYTDNKQIRHGALAGMSHADNVVTFRNDGSAPCVIQGYPGVAALSPAGRQIQQAVRVAGVTVPAVTLAPGRVASAEIFGNTASCTTLVQVAGLLVTAPDQRTSTRLGEYGTLCVRSLRVGPVLPGNSAGLTF